MKTLILLTSFFTLTCFGIGSTTTTKQIKNINGSFTSDNTIYNSGFELGSGGWTASGGTFTTTTTAANVGRGSVAGSFDGSAAAQTLTSSAITIPAGLYGKNAVISCNVQGASATLTVAAWDGSANLSVATPITSQATYARTSVNFIAPTSGTVAVQFKTVAVNEPIIYIDDCYIGAADTFNISQVSQASFVGSAKTIGAANCVWTGTSAAIADMPTDSDCSAATLTGSFLAPTVAKTPGFKVTNLPPGVYYVYSQGNYGGTADCNFRIYDGTNFTGTSNSNNDRTGGLAGTFTYTTTQASLDFTIQQRGTSCTIYNDLTSQNYEIGMMRFPSTSEIAIRPESMLQFGFLKYAGTANCTWIFSSASFANLALDADCPTPTVSGSGVAPGTKIPAMVVNNVPAGKYLVMVQGANIMGGGGDSCSMQIHDGTTGKGYTAVYNTTNQALAPISLMGVFEYSTAQSTLTFNVQGRKDSGAGTCALANDAVRNLEISIIPISQSINVPLLVGSVTSGNAGALRIEAAELNCDASSAITSQTSSVFVATIGNRSTTSCAITFTAGTWLSAPYCTFSTKAAANSSGLTVTSTTAGTIFGPSADYDGYLTCIGVR